MRDVFKIKLLLLKIKYPFATIISVIYNSLTGSRHLKDENIL